MSNIVLKVENLYKRYRLGNVDRTAFKEDVISFMAKLQGKPDPYESYITSNELAAAKDASEIKSRYVWSLQDINFEVQQGEILGIIGKNGAGKSTLLKILSKTTAPTKGNVKVKGRIASLLEVGTGFHPDLTGRENIYMNGAIMGMMRHEITRKLDEIIAFAGVEAFIDTPVKRYSSGMYVRLAFAVAAHLEPDILIIDEVLAVGDAEFQKKCIGKMKDVSRGEGRTVLFVSHDMRAVKSLCQKALVLKNGIIEIGLQNVQDAINEYSKNKNIFMDYMFPLVLDNELVITDFRIEQFGIEKDEYESECPTKISIGFELLKDIKLFRFGIFIKSAQGELISASLLADWEPSLETLSKGKYVIEGSIAPNFLLGGVYRIEIHGSIHGVKNYCIENFIQRDIKVISPSNYNIQHITEPSFGYVISNFNWKLSK